MLVGFSSPYTTIADVIHGTCEALDTLFPDLEVEEAAVHKGHPLLSVTPHLQHLEIHENGRDVTFLTGVDDVLDLVPSLHTLALTAEADDCTDQEELFIPLPSVLARHLLLHSIQCTGEVDMSVADVLAIASHPRMGHIELEGILHEGDEVDRSDLIDFNSSRVEREEEGEEEEEEREEGYRKPPPECSGDGVTARLACCVTCKAKKSASTSRPTYRRRSRKR